jgi:hypothetical protein
MRLYTDYLSLEYDDYNSDHVKGNAEFSSTTVSRCHRRNKYEHSCNGGTDCRSIATAQG